MKRLIKDFKKFISRGNVIDLAVAVIIGGAFQFKKNEAIILTEVAELGCDIDTARAELAKERAEAKITSAETQRDIKLANAALARAMVRLKAASKR